MTRRICYLLCSAAYCLAAMSCSSHQAEAPPRPGPPGLLLPAPSSLGFAAASGKGASYTDNDLNQPGSDYRADLPNNRAASAPPGVQLTPDFGPGAGMAGLAYCLYGFTGLSGYDRDEVVKTQWSAPPAEDSTWIGLADWDADRWEWFPLDSDLSAATESSGDAPLGDYIDFGGGLLCAVVLVGQEAAALTNLRIGTYPPQAILEPTPNAGIAPLEVTLDAGQSSDSDGTIVGYAWDLDGDMIFETDGGGNATLQHTFGSPGTHDIGVRVTDNMGATGLASAFVSIYEEWNHTWGKATDDVTNAVLAHEDDIYIAGQLDVNNDADLVLQKYSLSGSRAWSKTWDSGDLDIPRALALSADGNTIYLAGYTGGGSGGLIDMLLQAWDTSGNLKWTRTWGGDQSDYGYALVVANGGVFLCGTSSSFADPQLPQAVILRFSENGSLDWQRQWGGGSWDECFSACLIPTLFGNPSIALAGDTDSFGAGQMDLLYLRFGLDGSLSAALTWGDGDVQAASGIVSSLLDGTCVVGREMGAQLRGLALRVTTGKPSFAYAYDGGVGIQFKGVAYDSGDLVPVGSVNMSADLDLLAGRINLDGGGFSLTHHAKSGGAQSGECVARLMDGSFVFGGKEDDITGLSWQSLSASATDRTAIAWQSVNLQPEVLSISAQSLSILPTFGSGTSDTGGGLGDMSIGVHKL